MILKASYIYRQDIEANKDIIKSSLPGNLYSILREKINNFFEENIEKDTLANQAAAWNILESFINFFKLNNIKKEEMAKILNTAEPYTRKKIYYQPTRDFLELKSFWKEDLDIDERILLGIISFIKDGRLVYADLLQEDIYSGALILDRLYTKRLIEDLFAPGVLEPPREEIQRAPEVSESGIFPSQIPVQSMQAAPVLQKERRSSVPVVSRQVIKVEKKKKANWLGLGMGMLVLGGWAMTTRE